MGINGALTALTVGMASAQATPDAAQLLSRYPAGTVPDAPAVHAALDAVATGGDRGALALLQSLRRHESGSVRSHAEEAEETGDVADVNYRCNICRKGKSTL